MVVLHWIITDENNVVSFASVDVGLSAEDDGSHIFFSAEFKWRFCLEGAAKVSVKSDDATINRNDSETNSETKIKNNDKYPDNVSNILRKIILI